MGLFYDFFSCEVPEEEVRSLKSEHYFDRLKSSNFEQVTKALLRFHGVSVYFANFFFTETLYKQNPMVKRLVLKKKLW